ncbi:MAG TPA: DNA polymerase Y family protein [Alphaproteobacteria bacterium]|jgi:protein ImuB|nr:DNA polymerase Y family protein [Alphaproteobacteria bacterium]
MKLADARALVPGLAVADAMPEADGQALAALAGWCTRYSPWTATDGEDGIRLEITGCAHLFGGEAGIVADMARRLHAFGVGARGAIADTPAAAWGWARFRPRKAGPILKAGDTASLLSLPAMALRLEPESLETLATLGLDTVRSVADLPRGPLTRRLGDTVLGRLDRMFGRTAEPISPHIPADPWVTRLIFAEPIGRREDIDAAAERLLAHLCREMGRKGQGARRLNLAFYRVDGEVRHIGVGTSHPSHTPAHIMRLFAERLDTVDPGFGIEAMVLEATETQPLTAEQTGFSVSGEMDMAALAGLIDRLQNRLGRSRVLRLLPVESHLPERAERREPAVPRRKGRKVSSSFKVAPIPTIERHSGESRNPVINLRDRGPMDSGFRRNDEDKEGGAEKPRKPLSAWIPPEPPFEKALRPLRLLPDPEPVQATALVPDDPPLVFQWQGRQHRIRVADGPERIGPEWWRPEAEKGSLRRPRDYYRVEDEEGRRFWLYREGLYGAQEEPRWFLHGFFA